MLEHFTLSSLKLVTSSKLPQCLSKAIQYYKAGTFFFLLAHTGSRCIMTAVVEVVSCVDANANPGRQTNSTYCPLYRRRTKNIISRHKRRCHCVHQCEPCLNIQFPPCTWGGSFDVYGRDFMSRVEYQRKGWL